MNSPFPQAELAAAHKGLAWDDLQLVLLIGRHGGLSGAARALGVNHATVFRRLNAAETRLGVRLFERFRTGYAATPAGETAIALAERMAEEVEALERRLAGQDLRASGTVRVTTTDTLLPLLADCLAELRQREPAILVELVASNTFFSLTRREADIAVRPTAEPPETLVGRRIADIAYAIYAARGHAVAGQAWLAPDEALAYLPSARWLRHHVPESWVVGRANTLLGLRELARAGLGLAALPCFLGDVDPNLVRVGDPVPELAGALWLLTHEDLRHVARVRAVMDGLAASLVARRAVLEGQRPVLPD
jgi:DNA-binding transcriptional LysR family regulator